MIDGKSILFTFQCQSIHVYCCRIAQLHFIIKQLQSSQWLLVVQMLDNMRFTSSETIPISFVKNPVIVWENGETILGSVDLVP